MERTTTTIRLEKETKEKLSKVKGDEITYDKFIDYLIDYFLGNTK